MVTTTEEIVRQLHASADADQRLPVGIGLHFGIARVGNVGVGEVKDFTAVGDVVNTAARLQACAAAGEIAMSEAVYEQVRERYPALPEVDFDVKGKTDVVAGRLLAFRPTRRAIAAATYRRGPDHHQSRPPRRSIARPSCAVPVCSPGRCLSRGSDRRVTVLGGGTSVRLRHCPRLAAIVVIGQ